MARLVSLLLVLLAIAASAACGSALGPSEVYARSVDTMRQQTFHLDGKIDFTIKDSSSMNMSMSLTMQGDAQAPDRFRGSMNMRILGQDASQEMIAVGGQTWTRQPGEAWRESGSKSVMTSTGIFLSASSVKRISELASETIDGRAMRHLVVDFDFKALSEGDPHLAQTFKDLASAGQFDESAAALKLDHWVDAKSGMLRRQRAAMDLDLQGASVAVAVTLDYSRIGEPITPPIAAPR